MNWSWNNSSLAPLALMLAGVIFLSGCYRAWVSQGQIAPNAEWRSQVVMAGSWISGNEIEFFVKAGNGVSIFWDFGKNSPPFAISLWFSPKTPDFVFNPKQVFLQIPGVGSLYPSKVYMVEASSNIAYTDWSCADYQGTDDVRGQPYVLRRGSCFHLYFNSKAPAPEVKFSMRIDGLVQNGRKIVIPDIQFIKGSFKVMDFPFIRP